MHKSDWLVHQKISGVQFLYYEFILATRQMCECVLEDEEIIPMWSPGSTHDVDRGIENLHLWTCTGNHSFTPTLLVYLNTDSSQSGRLCHRQTSFTGKSNIWTFRSYSTDVWTGWWCVWPTRQNNHRGCTQTVSVKRILLLLLWEMWV